VGESNARRDAAALPLATVLSLQRTQPSRSRQPNSFTVGSFLVVEVAERTKHGN
jgi:hypothetical protein